MIFSAWRLSGRLSRAEKKIRKSQFDEAQTLLVSVLNTQPDDRLVYLAYARLVVTEHHRGNLRNSLHYARLCIEDADNFPEFWENTENSEILERVKWYREQFDAQQIDRRRVGEAVTTAGSATPSQD